MVVLNALRDILSTPAILVGLLALRSPLPDVVSGTLKTIIGFLVLGGGATILIGALDPLGKMIEDGLGLQGVVPTNEAVVGLALEDFGARTAGIMGLAFVVNLVLARLSPLSYVFLTGHHVLFMSALAAVVLDSAGIGGVSLLLIGALIVGSLMVIMPALAMPFVRRIIDGEDIAVGHFGTLGYITSALVGRAVGNPEKSTEDVRVPRSLSFFRDNLVSTAVAMLVVYLLFTALAGPSFVSGLSDGTNPFVFAVVQALTFAAGVWVILVGVRMILGEIVPAFEGISQKIIPNAVPALDIPIIFPYAPTAVPIGFLASTAAGVVALPFLGPLGLALIIPGMVPHFFVGGGAGVFGNTTGGRRGAVLGAFANGLIITLLPALLLAYLGQLGLANTTFGDSDFAWVGILLGSVANLGVVFAWALAVLFVALAFALGYLFPVLRPRQESPEEASEGEDAVGEEAAGRPRTT
ncbi:MAG: PTS ascorbate transporter subunit IIC [Rubrobacteraceae bacterium]